jgi:hypothetical protein
MCIRCCEQGSLSSSLRARKGEEGEQQPVVLYVISCSAGYEGLPILTHCQSIILYNYYNRI